MLQSLSAEGGSLRTAFNSITRLRALLKATSEDEVPPTAVLAAERLGDSVYCSHELYSAAVDVLEQSGSTRIANTDLSFGLSREDTAKQIAISSGGIRAFVLISAMRICCDQGRVAEALYAFLSASGKLQHVATSAKQFDKLIAALDCYGEQLNPSLADNLSEVRRAMASEPEISAHPYARAYWVTLYPKELAEIVNNVFDALRAENCAYIELSGQRGLVWITTMLKWLNPSEFGLFYKGKLIDGSSEGKVRIEIYGAPDVWWKQTLWRSGSSVSSTIEPQIEFGGEAQIRTVSKIYRSQTYNYLEDINSLAPSSKEMGLIGAWAAAIVDFVLQYQKSPGLLIRHASSSLQPRPLRELFPPNFIRTAGALVEDFGWDLEKIKSARRRFLDCLQSNQEVFGDSPLLMSIDDDELRKMFGQLDMSASNLRSYAATIAVEALVSGHIDFGNLEPYYIGINATWLEDYIFRGRLFNLSDWQEQCWQVATAQRYFRGKSLVHSAEGRVVFQQVVTSFSTNIESVLVLKVIPGRIRLASDVYSFVKEEEATNGAPSGIVNEKGWPKEMDIFDPTGKKVVLKPPEESAIQHSIFFARQEESLIMRTLIKSAPQSARWESGVSFATTIQNLVFAVHIRPPKSLGSNRAISKDKLKYKSALALSCEADVLAHVWTHGKFYMTCKPGNKALRFFNTHPSILLRYGLSPKTADTYFIQQEGASMADCLHEINDYDTKGNTILFTGHDFDLNWQQTVIEKQPMDSSQMRRLADGKHVLQTPTNRTF